MLAIELVKYFRHASIAATVMFRKLQFHVRDAPLNF